MDAPERRVEHVRRQRHPLFDRAKLIGFQINFVDVSDTHRMWSAARALNQELESAYEELQSTSEALETTNEELQSTHEELQTTNDEVLRPREAS